MNPPHDASDFENVPIRRSTAVLDAERLAGARAARAQHAHAVRLVDHQPRAVLGRQLGHARHVADVALHRVDAVDHHEHAAAVGGRRSSIVSSLSSRLWRNGRTFARDIATPSMIEAWSPESQITVSTGRGSPRGSRRWPGSPW